jgi:AraC-like DNA-binding protein
LRALPQALVVTKVERAQHPWLDEVERWIVRQIFSGEPGAHASVRRLSEILFIEVVRATSGQSPALSSVLTALGDAKIARAIAAMHKNPERAWTVETLAAEAAMSRSSFAERFQELMGCGPLGYLADWRMQKARAMLARSERPSPTSRRASATSRRQRSRAPIRKRSASRRRRRGAKTPNRALQVVRNCLLPIRNDGAGAKDPCALH